jgi:hypothetical protein
MRRHAEIGSDLDVEQADRRGSVAIPADPLALRLPSRYRTCGRGS